MNLVQNIEIKIIDTVDPLYQQEQRLRNEVLLRPVGMPDNSWEMFDKEAIHFIAIHQSKVVGCVLLIITSNQGRFIQMAVSPNMQGQGLGKKLLTALFNFARQQNLTELTCHARCSALNFYKSLGFTEYGEVYEEVGIPHVNMRYLF